MTVTAYDDLRQEVSALLNVTPESIEDSQDLFLLGLDSIRIMSLLNSLRANGVDATFAELANESTLDAWWAIAVAKRTGSSLGGTATAEVDEEAPFELTPVQHAYWIGRQDGQVLGGVGCHFYAEFEGQSVEPERLERAVLALAARHDLLRASFLDDGTQQIMKRSSWEELPVHDLRACESVDAALEVLRGQLSHHRLEVERGTVFDVHLSLMPGGKTRLHVSVDLLVADVRSIQILLHELAALYVRPDTVLPAIDFSFSRYRSEQEAVRDAEHERGREYWQGRLRSLPRGPQLPLVIEPERIGPPTFRRRAFTLAAHDWNRFAERARRNNVTPAMALATAFTEVLTAWSADPHFTLSLPTFDRQTLHPAVPRIVADFTNLIMLEVDGSGDDSFATRASRLQAQFRADIDHADYSGIEVLRDLARARPGEGIAAPVVFACNLGGGDLVGDEFRRCLGVPGWGVSQTPQVWLDHQVTEVDEGLFLNWDAVDELFPEGMLDSMFETYQRLLEGLARSDWSQPVCESLPAAQQVVRVDANATQGQESGRLLQQAFFANSARTPERVALNWADSGQLTYGELADSARRTAGLLVSHGVTPDDLVGITLPKGPDQVAAVLGVLWAGAAYVPVGTDQPPHRRNRIFQKAGVRVVLTAGATAGWSDLCAIDVAEAATVPPLAIQRDVSVDSLAYVIFTSGSTGEPKGVEISHRAAVNTVEDINARFDVVESDRVLAVSALDFDLSVYDLFGLLSVGGAVVLIDEDSRREARRWLELVRRHGVTVWNSVPALLDMLLVVSDEGGSGLRLVLTSGDWIGLDLPARLSERWPACRMIALGGATEAAIWSNFFEVTEVAPEWKSIPYGRPLTNQSYRVVDGRGRDCPDGVTGELWIGGIGVARGYRGDPEITDRQFVRADGKRWYRTGDLGRYWADGTLEFLGRIDQQVKIRGHRIELGEIEAALENHPTVTHAIAVATGGTAKHLAVAIVTASATSEEAHAWLAERVPTYMVPDRILILSKAPLTANGKVDRKKIIELLEPSSAVVPEPIDPPVGDVETATGDVWAHLLGLERVGRRQSFFALGGDSLLATRLVTRLRGLGLHGAELRQLFAKPILADFAATLTRGPRAAGPGSGLLADPEHRHEPFPATDIQRAYWTGRTEAFVLGRIGSHFYTEFDGANIQIPRLEEAWNRLIIRHEMLRAVFDDDGRQRVLPEVPRFVIPVARAEGKSTDALDALRNDMSHQVMDPARWPLFDVQAVRHGDGRVRLGVSLDNLILDALSVLTLFAELGQLYDELDLELPEIGLSFRDYVVGANPEPAEIAASQTYWRNRLADLPPAPQLPLRKDPALISRPRFVRHEARLDAAAWSALTERARMHDLTPSAVLLGCYAEILATWSAQPDLTLNLTIFDRREVHPHIDRVLGDFTSLFLVAHRSVPGESWLAAARRLQEQMWLDLDHSEVSAVWVLRELAKHNGVSEIAMPVVFTSALGVTKAVSRPMALPFAERIWGISQTPQVWLDHQVMEVDGGLALNWDAVEDLFPDGMLNEMLDAYRRLLETLSRADWSRPLSDFLPTAQQHVYPEADGTAAGNSARFPWHGSSARPDRSAEVPRAELGEIEAVMESHPLVARAVVTRTGPREQRRLAAAIVCEPSETTATASSAVSELRASAASRLPDPSAPRARMPDGDDESILVEGLLTHLIANELGFDGSACVRATLADDLHIAEVGRQVFELWLNWLESRDVLAVQGPKVTMGARWSEAADSVPSTSDGRLGGAATRYASLAAAVSERLPVLAAVLRGERDALTLLDDEVLSPEALIHDDPPTVANVVEIARQISALSLDLGRPVRIAELGARTGRTAERLLGLVSPSEVAYSLLETSATLRNRAQSRIVDYPHEIEFARLNDNLVPEGLFHCFDVVVANNAVHRFSDVATGLAVAQLLLAPGGVLLAVESSLMSPLALLSAAVLEHGFSYPSVHSTDNRGPLLDASQWRGELRRGQWDGPHVFGEESSSLLRAVQPLTAPSPSFDDVRRSMAERLPAHMVPEIIAVLPPWPSNAGALVDRDTVRQLFEPHDGLPDENSDAPEGEIESRVADIWMELLGVPRVGRHQSFFSLGGDSILATRLVEETRQRLSAELSLRRLFTAPTVAGIAALITDQRLLIEAGAIEDEVI